MSETFQDRDELLRRIEELERENADLRAAAERAQDGALSYETLATILDGIEADIYVSDMGSHEVLFMNRRMMESFGGDFTGAKCYEAFTINDRPCPHCTTPELLDENGVPHGPVRWEAVNSLTGRLNVNVDRVMRWTDGRLVKVQVATDMTERVEAERALRKSEAMLKESQTMARVGGWEYDEATGTSAWTDEVYRILECDRDVIPNLDLVLSFFAEEDREPFKYLVERAKEKHEPYDVTLRVRTAGGNVRWVRIKGRPVVEDGQTVRLIGTIQDVTEQHVASLALAESERRWRTLLQTIPAGVVVHNNDGSVRTMNAVAEELLGVAENEAAGENVVEFGWHFLHEDEKRLEPDEFPVSRVLATGEETKTVLGVVRRGRKEPVWLVVNAVPVFDQREDVSEVVVSFLDITEYRRADADRRHWLGMFEKLVTASPNCILRMDTEGRLTYVSPRGVELFGGGDESGYIGEDVLVRVAPEDRERARENIRAYLDGRKARTEENQYRMLRSSGEIFHGAVSSAAITDRDGNVSGLISIVRDVSERIFMERNLLEAKEQAEAASRAKGEFLANMSHEIRTPLNGVLGMLQLATLTDLNEEQREYVETALTSGRSLLRIINDVLDFSKIEAGKIEIGKEAFNLPDMIESVIEVFRNQARRKRVELVKDVGEDTPEIVLGDEGRLRQILFNLVGNAIKFTDNGEIAVRVRSESEGAVDLRLVFEVKDTGIGIPADKVENIFDSFTQVDGSYTRKHPGSGLGLSIVKRLVHLMHGDVQVSSEEGSGTTVRFEALLGVERRREERKDETEDAGIMDNTAKSKLLLVEDDDINRITTRLFLEKMGYEVDVAVNGREALEKCELETFDLVLMDIQMPEMDGMEAARRIREGLGGKTSKDVPIVAITAHAMKGDRERFIESGMDDYVAKPLDMRELAKILERLTGEALQKTG
jgi:PAS domain S-box-containing protein